ncbi:MAG TPA: VCBS repeat-containing protein, partial [Ignavibacteria bacterium]
MKKFILFSLVIIMTYFLSGFYFSDLNTQISPLLTNGIQFQNAPMPDAMGNINILESGGRDHINNISETDSFPVFPGFPKNVSGSTREGGIACNMDNDPEFEIVYNIGFTVQAWNSDGSSVPGWPKTVSSYPLEGAPAFGDIDGDGQGEIVVTNHGGTSGGNVYAFHKDGSNVTGFPINHGYCIRTPVLADIDNTGGLEIIVDRRESNEVWVYRGNGTVYPGWPKSINQVPSSSSAVGDITGDGFPEIISESYSSLYAWDRNGNALAGFPFTMPNGDVNSYSSPVLADVDNDGIREIAFGTHKLGGGGYVYLLKNDATIMPGWPKSTPYWIYSPPSVGFIDGDNILDIAIGDGGGTISFTPVFSLYARNKNGNAITG